MRRPKFLFLYKLIERIERNYRWWQHFRKIDKLKEMGLKIGRNVTIMPTAEIDDSYPYLISIGDNSSISRHVQLIAHDQSPSKFTPNNYERLGRIDIKENCFIGQSAIILPNVTIGPNVLVAAGSVVNKDIPPNTCVVGVPARVYAKFDDYIQKNIERANKGSVIDSKETMHPVPSETREKISGLIGNQHVFVTGFEGRRINTFPYIIKPTKVV